MKTAEAAKAQAEQKPATQIHISYFTDPLCCWSWAMEPQVQKLLQAYGPLIDISYRMGGLLRDWGHYRDSINAVYTPTQMGPLWAYAGEITKVPIDAGLWVNDPPDSSYPACRAVKCMELQDKGAAREYLLVLRKAAMEQQRNIAREDVLFDIARDIVRQHPALSMPLFESHWKQGMAQAAFEKDLEEKTRYGIIRFPTLLLRCNITTMVLTGYRRLDQLAEAVKHLLEHGSATEQAGAQQAGMRSGGDPAFNTLPPNPHHAGG